jgi:hypothetical protein
VVLKVAQTLFFKSNITEIESKLGINQWLTALGY